jgi:hypothetical protein
MNTIIKHCDDLNNFTLRKYSEFKNFYIKESNIIGGEGPIIGPSENYFMKTLRPPLLTFQCLLQFGEEFFLHGVKH